MHVPSQVHVEQCGADVLPALMAAEVEGITSKYWDKCKPISSSSESYDAKVAQRLWDVSSDLVKL